MARCQRPTAVGDHGRARQVVTVEEALGAAFADAGQQSVEERVDV
jgi:hypothetical protein